MEITGGFPGEDAKTHYAVIGGDSQVLNVKLSKGEAVTCEPGVLMFMDPDVTPYTNCTCSIKRWCGGESQWKTTFTNNSDHDAIVGLTPNRPAKVVPVDMTSIKANGAKGLHTKQGAWMASIGEVHLSISTECNPCKCCCAGQGMVRMMLQGTGTAFLEGHGTIMTKVLQAGEKIVVDQNSVLAWADTVDLTFRTAGSLCVCCCGGEGMFNAVLDGGSKGGFVVLESMPFSKYKSAILTPNGNNRGPKTANV